MSVSKFASTRRHPVSCTLSTSNCSNDLTECPIWSTEYILLFIFMSNLESHAHVLFMERFGKMPERLEEYQGSAIGEFEI